MSALLVAVLASQAATSAAPSPTPGPRFLYRTVGGGGSFGGAPLRQEIGLGDARAVAWVEVFWPASGATQRVDGLQPRRRYLIREGTREASERAWPASTRTANAPR